MPVSVTFHHVGITVSNLERSVEFYRKAFGLEPGLVLEVSGPSSAKLLGLPRSHHRAALLPVGDFAIELIEFFPHRREFDGRQDDVGYVYLGLVVEDLDEVYERLTREGLEFISEPQHSGDKGPAAGTKTAILRDPDGKTIEFLELSADSGLKVEALRAGVKAGVSLDQPYVMGD